MKSKSRIASGLSHPSREMAYAKTGFTIIELLTAMSIIVILLSLLLPSLNMVRRYSREVTQKGQFHDIGNGLEMFSIDFDGYPDSSANDNSPPTSPNPYCGAMKLCEAMIGQDGLGFHPDSVFDDMGMDIGGKALYFVRGNTYDDADPADVANLRARKKYIEGQNVQIASIGTLFSPAAPFDVNCAVLCDVFKRNNLRSPAGEKLGMPILYYKADPSKLLHDVSNPDNPSNIYNYKDNHAFLNLGLPWDTATKPPLYQVTGRPQGEEFYKMTLDKNSLPLQSPLNKNSYILISAGWDGLYGTRDDVLNFMTK